MLSGLRRGRDQLTVSELLGFREGAGVGLEHGRLNVLDLSVGSTIVLRGGGDLFDTSSPNL